MNISNNNLFELEQIKNKTKIDSFLLKFTYEDEPKNINDTEFFSNLNSKYFKRTIIDNSKLIKFRDIFKEKYHFKTSETACEPIFRDIFIFRKKNKLIGIAKICFECKKCYILGTNANTNEFGQSGDYNKLKNLVKNQPAANKKFVLWLVDSDNIRKFIKLKYGLKVKFEVLTQPQTQIFSR